MAYAVENALYQWREGERRIANAARARPGRPPGGRRRGRGGAPAPARLELRGGRAGRAVRRDTDWALEIAGRNRAGTDAASVVDAAFARYVREAKDFAGGQPREKHQKPE